MRIVQIPDLSAYSVLCVGDVMVDRFVYGNVNRISPEAPVPVLSIQRDFYVLGGAGNVVRNLSGLGLKVYFVGLVGNDEGAKVVSHYLSQLPQVEFHLIVDEKRKTPVKTRFLAQGQHILRVDEETSSDYQEDLKVFPIINEWLSCCHGVILSDYNKGFLSKSLCQYIIKNSKVNVIVDPKGKNYQKYKHATVIKPNLKELMEVCQNNLDSQNTINKEAEKILKEYEAQAVVVTQGSQGMSCITLGEARHIPTQTKEVYDVSGAGDTTIATLMGAMVSGLDVFDACIAANAASGIVIGKTGTATITLSELNNVLCNTLVNKTNIDKICNLEILKNWIKEWRRLGLKIGFSNGCFDLLHKGHLHILQEASYFCDKLVIAINSDKSVARLKGESRPIQSEDVRAEVIAALAMVDAVIIFDEDTPYKLIKHLLPDVLVKGKDYSLNEVVGADIVLQQGGQVHLVELKENYSTTNTIKKLRQDT